MSLIYTDGSCGKHTRGQGWGSVVDEKGGDLLAGDDEACQGFMARIEHLPVGRRRILTVKFKDVASISRQIQELEEERRECESQTERELLLHRIIQLGAKEADYRKMYLSLMEGSFRSVGEALSD